MMRWQFARMRDAGCGSARHSLSSSIVRQTTTRTLFATAASGRCAAGRRASRGAHTENMDRSEHWHRRTDGWLTSGEWSLPRGGDDPHGVIDHVERGGLARLYIHATVCTDDSKSVCTARCQADVDRTRASASAVGPRGRCAVLGSGGGRQRQRQSSTAVGSITRRT